VAHGFRLSQPSSTSCSSSLLITLPPSSTSSSWSLRLTLSPRSPGTLRYKPSCSADRFRKQSFQQAGITVGVRCWRLGQMGCVCVNVMLLLQLTAKSLTHQWRALSLFRTLKRLTWLRRAVTHRQHRYSSTLSVFLVWRENSKIQGRDEISILPKVAIASSRNWLFSCVGSPIRNIASSLHCTYRGFLCFEQQTNKQEACSQILWQWHRWHNSCPSWITRSQSVPSWTDAAGCALLEQQPASRYVSAPTLLDIGHGNYSQQYLICW